MKGKLNVLVCAPFFFLCRVPGPQFCSVFPWPAWPGSRSVVELTCERLPISSFPPFSPRAKNREEMVVWKEWTGRGMNGHG